MKLLKQQEELIVKLNKLGMFGMADDLRNQFDWKLADLKMKKSILRLAS